MTHPHRLQLFQLFGLLVPQSGHSHRSGENDFLAFFFATFFADFFGSAAADAFGAISSSIVSAEYPGRGEALSRIANSKEIPALEDLEELWFALQTEMTQSGEVSQFNVEVTSLDGSKSTQSVTRIGTFNLVSADGYLTYNDEVGQEPRTSG